jgi:hypothetical protein
VDLVAVLDTSGSMGAPGRLDSVKQAMGFVIDNLGDDDRLSIVPFRRTGNDHLRYPLSEMSEENRTKLKTVVNRLQPGGGDDLESANEAAKILQQRTPDDISSRIGRIIYLSDGTYNVKDIIPDYPANTFGLSASHQPETMRYISDCTSGVYSYVNTKLENIKDAFAQSIGGLTSVTAIDVKIKLQTNEGVSISSIQSGSYRQSISADKQVGTIEINDLYAGEKKNFIVFLSIPEGKDKLITISGLYRNVKISKNDAIQFGKREVVVKRPKASTPSSEVVRPEVAAELVRGKLVKVVSSMATEPQLNNSNLQSLWDGIRNSENGLEAPEKIISNLDKGVTAMQREGKPFMLSWLTSHLRQRATTKDSPSESGDFQTSVMKTMLRLADDAELSQEEESESDSESDSDEEKKEIQPVPKPAPQLEVKGKLKIMWEKVITCARSNALPCGALLLLSALLLMLYVRIPVTNPPGMIIVKVDKDDTTSPTDASRHPGWPKMEKSLEVTMLRSMEDFGIASVFHGTSIEEVRDATNKYLYLAIVHASVLGSRFRSEDVGTISMLEEKVKSLEAEKNAHLVKIEALAKEKEEIALSAENCPAVKESDEALQRANTRIVELEKQLRDKKAFAENVMSELNNAEDHLKTCGQRVDMLEDKVREMEGVVIN